MTRVAAEARPARLPSGSQTMLGHNGSTSPPRVKGLKRGPLRRVRKSVASRYYWLLPGHAAIGPYLKDRIRKTDDRC